MHVGRLKTAVLLFGSLAMSDRHMIWHTVMIILNTRALSLHIENTSRHVDWHYVDVLRYLWGKASVLLCLSVRIRVTSHNYPLLVVAIEVLTIGSRCLLLILEYACFKVRTLHHLIVDA